jgi:protein-disulfide isomerase
MKRWTMILACAAIWCAAPLSLAQTKSPAKSAPAAKTAAKPAPRPEPATREQAEAILEELRLIRALLERQLDQQEEPTDAVESASIVRISNGDDLILGRPDAPLTLIEFTDFQCTYCKRFHDATFPEIRKKYIDTGKVRFVHRDLPLESHTQAYQASRAARCAGEQEQFWPMRDHLVANAHRLSPAVMNELAGQLPLDQAKFQSCLASGRFDVHIQRDIADALAAGIEATPGFVIGPSRKGYTRGVRFLGAQGIKVFEALIESALADLEGRNR